MQRPTLGDLAGRHSVRVEVDGRAEATFRVRFFLGFGSRTSYHIATQ
jgi:hypothetical protein